MTDRNDDARFDIKFEFPEPTEESKEKQLTLWATHYYVYNARAVDDGEPLLDMDGQELGPKLSVRDWCLGAVEGTIRVTDSNNQVTVYNYAGVGSNKVDCSGVVQGLPGIGKTRYQVAQGPFGTGVNGMILVPFRTIAVDKRQTPIPYRSVIYIPAARGREIKLPSGNIVRHDGYFYAADTGGAIKGNHIDVFGGISHDNPFPNFIKSNSQKTFDAFLIKDQQISDSLAELHKKHG